MNRVYHITIAVDCVRIRECVRRERLRADIRPGYKRRLAKSRGALERRQYR
jgi:hypothetical protein